MKDKTMHRDTMTKLKLKTLLLTLALVIKYSQCRYPAIKERFKGENRAIKIQAGRTEKTFTIKSGRFHLSTVRKSACTSGLIWTDAGTALSVMTSGYDGDMIKAFQNNQAHIQGDALEIFWFFSTLKEIKDELSGSLN